MFRVLLLAISLLALASPSFAAPSKTNPDRQNLYVDGLLDTGDEKSKGLQTLLTYPSGDFSWLLGYEYRSVDNPVSDPAFDPSSLMVHRFTFGARIYF